MQAFLLTWLITNMLKKLFFGTLRAAEIEVLDRWRHSSVIAPYENHIVVLSCLNYPQQFRLRPLQINFLFPVLGMASSCMLVAIFIISSSKKVQGCRKFAL